MLLGTTNTEICKILEINSMLSYVVFDPSQQNSKTAWNDTKLLTYLVCGTHQTQNALVAKVIILHSSCFSELR